MRARLRSCQDGEQRYDLLWFWCPACDEHHAVKVNHPYGWGWNGSQELPTITPSILVRHGADGSICHSFVTDGKIRYLSDCTHTSAGKTLDLPEVEGWGYGQTDK